MLGHFVLGFLDDYIKVVLKRNLGLKAKQKLLGQFIIAIIVTYIGINYTGLTQDVWIPFIGQTYDIGWFYYVLVIGVLIGCLLYTSYICGLYFRWSRSFVKNCKSIK